MIDEDAFILHYLRFGICMFLVEYNRYVPLVDLLSSMEKNYPLSVIRGCVIFLVIYVIMIVLDLNGSSTAQPKWEHCQRESHHVKNVLDCLLT